MRYNWKEHSFVNFLIVMAIWGFIAASCDIDLGSGSGYEDTINRSGTVQGE